jgi:Xaa-Pro dipeptidase
MPSREEYPCLVPYDPDARAPWIELRFTREEYAKRLERVRVQVDALGLDALLVVGDGGNPGDVAYLSNYAPHFGTTLLLLPLVGDSVVITDALLHGEPMHSMLWDVLFEDLRPAAARPDYPPGTLTELAVEAIHERNLATSRIGIASSATLSMRHADELRAALPDVRWSDGTLALLRARALKSPAEIAHMRRACEITGVGIQAALGALGRGVSEREVANAAHAAMFMAGAEELGFDTAVSSGPRAGLKHAAPTNRQMLDGDLVFLDMGAEIGGYHADISRCAGVGQLDADRQGMLDAAREIFATTFAAAKPGAPVRDLYRAAERAARHAGYIADYMPNGLGHGLGLALFELPFLGPDDTSLLEPGMIFALEPMLVRYGVGTAVVEETVLITDDGPETLSGLDW